jgi:hypothetical protein
MRDTRAGRSCGCEERHRYNDEQQTREHCPYSKTTGCLHEISSTFARIVSAAVPAVRADNLSWIIVYATVVINTFTFFVPVRSLLVGAIHCAVPDASSTRVSVAIQFSSQVFPPSSENDCSKRHEAGVMSEITNRTKIARPFSVS